jgi:phosphatidylinositol N-acetylglucosaminyltransferase subunit A
MAEAIEIVSEGRHDPFKAHNRVKSFYHWGDVTERTERVYNAVLASKPRVFWDRMQRYVVYFGLEAAS